MSRLFRQMLLVAAVLLLTNSLIFGDKLFEATFDSYSPNADIAGGSKQVEEFKAGDLQLRMYPGVGGKGNSINFAAGERCVYDLPGNMNPAAGTVTIWLSNRNWKLTDAPPPAGKDDLRNFFGAGNSKFSISIYEIWNHYIAANIVFVDPASGKQYAVNLHARVDLEVWKPGVWHRIDLTWNGSKAHLYIDGRIPPETETIIDKKPVPPTISSTNYPIKITPAPFTDGKIWFGHCPYGDRPDTVKETTAIDSVTIWGYPLSPDEILEGYQALIPPPAAPIKTNLCTVPKTVLPIEIDGNLDDDCWTRATKLQIYQRLEFEQSPQDKFYAYICHDGTNLRLAYSTEIAPRVCKYSAEVRDEGMICHDDCFEFHYRNATGSYQYIVNSAGSVYDSRTFDSTWNSNFKCATQVTDNGWSLELVIPMDEIGGIDSILGNKEDQQVNFAYATHEGIIHYYWHWGPTHHGMFETINDIKFSDKPDFVQLDALCSLEQGRMNLQMHAGDSIKGQAIIRPFSGSDVTFNGDLAKTPWIRQLDSGKQTLIITATDANDEEIFRTVIPTTVKKALELTYNVKLQQKKIQITTDFYCSGSAVLENLDKGLPVTLELRNPEDIVVSSTKVMVTKPQQTFDIDFPDAPAQGIYTIRADAGNNIVSNVAMRMPDLTPYIAKLGADHTVPEPWHPVKELGNGRFAVLDRIYAFDKSPIPQQVTASGDDLLSSSPKMRLEGKSIKWSAHKTLERFEDHIAFGGTGSTENFKLNWRGELWFDGMYKLDFSLSPDGDCQDISDFHINWSMPKEFSRYATDPLLIPWKDGKAGTFLGYRPNFRDNVLWMIGFEKGFLFWTKSQANWLNNPGEQPLMATQRGEETDVTVKIISRAGKLSKTAKYTFVFMGTPSRRPPFGFRSANNDGWTSIPHRNVQWGWNGWYDEKAGRATMSSVIGFLPGNPPVASKFFKEEFHDKGVKYLPYSMPTTLSTCEADFDIMDKQSICLPMLRHNGKRLGEEWYTERFCPNATDLPTDFQTWTMEKGINEYPGIDGAYFDIAQVCYCENREHGCGGVDVFGQPFTSSDTLGLRNFYMRIYKTAKKHDRGYVMIHAHTAFQPICHGFGDNFAPGENAFYIASLNMDHTYCEEISEDEYLSDYNWRKTGLGYTMILQNLRVTILMPEFKERFNEIRDTPEITLRGLTACWIYDLNPWAGHGGHMNTVSRFWKVRKDMKINTADFYRGYWESDAVKSSSPNMRTGYFLWKTDTDSPYKAVIIAGNFSREPQPASLILDNEQLGLNGTEELCDAWAGYAITYDALKDRVIPGNHFMLIGVLR
ncbi:MAG: hypothetical protein GX946_01640 [Oligosphaeraceae bacterium]|nr:hypothetical protein [Oligosphaeraceae bacterium]